MVSAQLYDLDGMPPISGGPGSIDGAGALLRALAGDGGSALVVADPGLTALGHTTRLTRGLASEGFEIAVFDAIEGEPGFRDAARASQHAKDCTARAIVGFGGGSALDLAKAVAVGAACDGPLTRFALGCEPLPDGALPILAIPTTSGTGSEMTRTAILSDQTGAKQWLWGQALKPCQVLLDPELTVGLPSSLTAATGLDALVHAMEAATNRNASAGNTAIALTAIRMIVAALPSAMHNPADLDARGAMQLGAAYAGTAIDNTGTAIAHAIGHALASMVKIHHGQAVAAAMAATLWWNVVDDDGRFARVADAMGGGRDARALPGLFAGLAASIDHSFDLPAAAALDAAALAAQIRLPENAPMLQANWRTPNDDDLLRFASRVISGS
ncbi:MAG: iron-containing alcohol dehydrogenase [Pseudomonadota bacterium]